VAEQTIVTPACTCEQHGVTGLDDLDALVNEAGVDQASAARAVWGRGAPLDVQLSLARIVARRVVRAGMADVLRQLRAAGVAV